MLGQLSLNIDLACQIKMDYLYVFTQDASYRARVMLSWDVNNGVRNHTDDTWSCAKYLCHRNQPRSRKSPWERGCIETCFYARGTVLLLFSQEWAFCKRIRHKSYPRSQISCWGSRPQEIWERNYVKAATLQIYAEDQLIFKSKLEIEPFLKERIQVLLLLLLLKNASLTSFRKIMQKRLKIVPRNCDNLLIPTPQKRKAVVSSNKLVQ